MNSTALARALMVYGITLPLAIFLGYTLGTPLDKSALLVIGLMIFCLCVPILLKRFHPILIFSWNASIVLALLPGRPGFWMLMAFVGLCIAVANRILDKQTRFLSARSVTITLLLFTTIVVLTAQFRGGLGLRSLGNSTYGSRGYFYILMAVAGYFAITSVRIPKEKAEFYTGLYFLSGVTAAIPHFIGWGGPALHFLFNFFPPGAALSQIAAQTKGSDLVRYGGFTSAGTSVAFFLFALHGIRGAITLQKWWRPVVMVLVVLASLMGGFRSGMVMLLLLFGLLFYFERLMRTWLFPAGAGTAVLALLLLLLFADRLPQSWQRSLSFLPIPLEMEVRANAGASDEFRLEMWKMLVPDLPKYLFIGKGYSLDPTDLYLIDISIKRGHLRDFEGSMAAGDYHSGPLSLYIPFGSFGVITFVAFLIACIRSLYFNYRYGEERLRFINSFLLAYFVTRVIFYCGVFGSISSDLYTFTGLIALSISLNGGVKKPDPLAPLKMDLPLPQSMPQDA